MADSRIKGITIELDGETTGLQKALSDVTKQSVDIQKELKDVDRLLKFDPSNVEAMAQKQKLLAAQIEATGEKLDRLKAAEQQVNEQFKNGDIAEAQYRSFRREIEFTEASLDKMKQSLSKVDDTASLKGLKEDLTKIPEASEKAEGSVKDLGSELVNLAAGAAAVGSIHELIEKSLDASSFNTKFNISFDVAEESKSSIMNAISTIETYGVDGEAALEGVRKQWALNKNASDESNSAVVAGAATIVAAYGDIDFNELIQETNEMSRAMGISNEEALALVNSLLKTGFPPDQLDIITEYGTQLKMAGYNAEEIQALFKAGVDTGTWNIDNLMDGLKEGRIKAAEFGQGVSKSMAALLEGTNISTTQLQDWGKAVAAGGKGGSEAMTEIAAALQGVDDQTQKNALGVALFGTKYEDQGDNIIKTLLNAKDVTVDLQASQENLNNATAQLNADPAIQMQQAMSNLMTALSPLLLVIAGIVSAIAQWMLANPNLTATVVAICSAITILVGLCMGLAPIFTTISGAAGILGIGISTIAAPVAIVVAAIAALITIGVLLYNNWDEIKVNAVAIWSAISDFFAKTWISIKAGVSVAWTNIKIFFSQLWSDMSNTITSIWTSIKIFFSQTWIDIQDIFTSVIGSIIEYVKGAWTSLKTNTAVAFNSIMATISSIWISIKNTISTLIDSIISTISGKFESMKTAIFEKMSMVKDVIKTAWNEAQSFLEKINLIEVGKNVIQGLINGIKSMIGEVGKAIKKIADSITDGIKDALDIHSPSRVTTKLGIFTGQGFVNGIKATIAEISKQSRAMAAAVTGNLPTDYDFSVSGSSGSSPAVNAGINQTVNIYSPSALSPAETAKQNKRVLQELAFGL